jgi:tetratricopeptide (TPR) repeat protein
VFLQAVEKIDNFYNEEAGELAEQAIKLDPDFAMAHFLWAQTATNTFDYLQRLNKAIALTDKISEPEKLLIFSAKAQAENNTALALEHLEKLVTLLPKSKRAHSSLGNFYYGLQEWDKAEKELRIAIEIDPDFAPPYNELGYALSNQGKYDDAITSLRKYSELRPDDPNPHDSMGEIYLWMGNHESSIKEFSKSLELDPNFTISTAGIGHNFVFQGEFENARSKYEEILEHAEDVSDTNTVYFWKAVSYLHEGKHNDAIGVLKEQLDFAKAHDSKYLMAAINTRIAGICIDMEDFDNAILHSKQVREIANQPDFDKGIRDDYHRACAYNEAIAFARLGKKDMVDPKVKEFTLLAESTGNPVTMTYIHSLNGLLAYWNDDYETAIAELNQSETGDNYSKYYLGLAYEKTNQNELAKKTFDGIAKYNRNGLYYALVQGKAKGKQ